MAAHVVKHLIRPMMMGVAITLIACGSVTAQDDTNRIFFGDTVGGIDIDPNGVLKNLVRLDQNKRDRLVAGLQSADQDVNKQTKMRMVSVNGLNQVIADSAKTGKPLPVEAQFMAGLQRIEYIIVSPDQKDLILVGPGEGWKVNAAGSVVGEVSGTPVLRLEDFLVAMRTVTAAGEGRGISVSIDPTPAGVKQLRQFYASNPAMHAGIKSQVEQAMGPQQISLTGVPQDSRFSQVLVAADYKMKRFSMGLEAAPIGDFPSVLEIAAKKGGKFKNGSPRFWMECNYDSVAKSNDGNVWQLRGQGVRTMTEDGFFNKSGQAVDKKGKVNKFAKQWADAMTNRFNELAKAEPVFRELRNVMDLAVVAAIIKQNNLLSKAGCSAAMILDKNAIKMPSWNTPKSVGTECSFINVRGDWVITASGGVQVDSWSVASNTEVVPAIAQVQATATKKTADRWWWNAN